MDNQKLRELMLDIECMTVLRHVMDNPAMSALHRLVCDCASEGTDEGELTYAYCEVYNAWLRTATRGKGGFVREALTAALFEERIPVCRRSHWAVHFARLFRLGAARDLRSH